MTLIFPHQIVKASQSKAEKLQKRLQKSCIIQVAIDTENVYSWSQTVNQNVMQKFVIFFVEL